jgi:hypothetical protein
VRLITWLRRRRASENLETFRLQLPAQRPFSWLDGRFPVDDLKLHESALDLESVPRQRTWQPMSLRDGWPVHLGAGGIECRESRPDRSSFVERAHEAPGDDVLSGFVRP